VADRERLVNYQTQIEVERHRSGVGCVWEVVVAAGDMERVVNSRQTDEVGHFEIEGESFVEAYLVEVGVVAACSAWASHALAQVKMAGLDIVDRLLDGVEREGVRSFVELGTHLVVAAGKAGPAEHVAAGRQSAP